MRIVRVTFVSLIAVGVCGALYAGLTMGLAAYVHVKSGTPLADAAPPSQDAASRPSSAVANATPRPAMESAQELLQRTWTAPRRGLSMPAPYASAPFATTASLRPSVVSKAWFPVVGGRTDVRLLRMESNRPLRVVPILDAPPPMPELALADSRDIILPTTPTAKATGPDPDRIRIAPIAAYRDGERPPQLADPTVLASERLLLAAPAPMRASAAPFERLVIPDPNSSSIGDIRTALPDDDAPATSPDRPSAIKLPAK